MATSIVVTEQPNPEAEPEEIEERPQWHVEFEHRMLAVMEQAASLMREIASVLASQQTSLLESQQQMIARLTEQITSSQNQMMQSVQTLLTPKPEVVTEVIQQPVPVDVDESPVPKTEPKPQPKRRLL
jgi:uncharacterized coiled-coil protein SlyX